MTLRERFERWAKRSEKWLVLERDTRHPNEYKYLEAGVAYAAYKAGFRAGRRG